MPSTNHPSQQYANIITPSAPPVPQYPTGYNQILSDDERMQKFAQLSARYEISHAFATRLRKLEGFEIVFICDDSGSMATAVGDASTTFSTRTTRWDELKQIVSITVDIASVLDPDGVDIYFLNRPPALHVSSSSQLLPAFANPPNGLTPITRVLRQILQTKRGQVNERKLLIIIATDGQPTDDFGTTDIKALETVLKHERQPYDRMLVTFCACTDDEQAVGYLNKWDKKLPFVDVCDDYRSEREEIWKKRGRQFPFSFGDYVVKILLGAVDPYFDNLDQKKVDVTAQHCCTVM